VRAAPITITCDCGKRVELPYGDRYTCGCGRRWNTAQIPAEEYWGVMREVRRYRNLVVGVAVAVCIAVLPLAMLVSQAFFFLLLLLLGAWAFYARPFLRRRVRAKLAERPTWKLRPE
jgi:hypothetical protein